jgi:hypothetical protein
LRVGAGYALEFAERYSIGPSVSFDFIRAHHEWERAVVFGVSFGVAFSGSVLDEQLTLRAIERHPREDVERQESVRRG